MTTKRYFYTYFTKDLIGYDRKEIPDHIPDSQVNDYIKVVKERYAKQNINCDLRIQVSDMGG